MQRTILRIPLLDGADASRLSATVDSAALGKTSAWGEVFWEDFLMQGEHLKTLYVDVLGFPKAELIDARSTEDQHHRSIRVYPEVRGVPDGIHKLIGRNYSYLEEGTLEGGVYRYRATPSTFTDAAFAVGKTEVQHGILVTELEVTAKVPLVGRTLESHVIALFERSWDRLRPFARKHIRAHR
jgi:Protein of unknown function (DUF2505)